MASATSGWPFSAASTSSGKTFSPPVLMHSEPRPSTMMVPSASTVAWSPGSAHRDPVPLDERRGRGRRVAQVAERDVSAAGQAADRARPGDDRLEVVVEHVGPLVDPQPGRPVGVVGRRLAPDLPGLRRAEPVGHDPPGQQLGQLGLGRGRQHGPTGAHGHERRQVVAPGVSGQDVEERPGHGVPHHHQGVDPLGLHQAPHLDRVEGAPRRGSPPCRRRRAWRRPASDPRRA